MTEPTLWDMIPEVAKRMPGQYFNTNKTSWEELDNLIDKNAHQNEAILKFFQDNPHENFTPIEVTKALRIFKESSVRRSMTCLTNPEYGIEKLVRLDIIRHKNHAWKLK